MVCCKTPMKNKPNAFNLRDLDMGCFLSYELTEDALTTKLFRVFTLNTRPLESVMTLREAEEKDITPLNRINWFSFFRRKNLSPVYTLQATPKSPRIFMRLNQGSHIALKGFLHHLHA